MKNLLFTILLTLIATALFAQVRVIDNFDVEPDSSYWDIVNSDNSTNSGITYTYQSAITHGGSNAMQVDWSAERAESWGGFTKLEHWHPDPQGVYDFSSHDSLSLWYYVKDTSSMGGAVHLRVQLFDVSDTEGGYDIYDTGVLELYYSFEYILTQEPGWNEIVLKMNLEDDTQGGGQYWNDKGFTQTGWAGITGNGILDKDKIKGWGIEFSIDGSNTGEVSTGSIIFDDMALKQVLPKTFVFFNGLSNPATMTEFFSWGGGAEVEEGAGSDGLTNAVKWTQGDAWTGLIWGFDPIDMSYSWPIDTLKFQMKAEPGVGNTRIQWEDSVAVKQGNANEGRLGFNFEPIADGQWHDYAFPMTEYFTTYYDGSTTFDTSAVMRLHMLAEGSGSGKVVYLDNVWLGRYEADLIAPEAPQDIQGIPATYSNLVAWSDVPGEEGESYHVYYGTEPVTEITDMTEEVASNIAEGVQSTEHILRYPVTDTEVTYYYAVVCQDAAGNKSVVSTSSAAVTNTARGVTTVHLGAPNGFAADGSLDDWAGIAPFRMYVSEGNGFLGGDQKSHDGDQDLSADVYVAMDNDYMYLAFDIEDDIINTDDSYSTWLRDSPDFFIGLYDWRGATHNAYQKGAEPDYHFRFNRPIGFSDNPGGLGAGTLFNADSSDDYAWEEDFPTGYTVECKIPFTRLAELGESPVFVPKDGMRVKIDVAINDADGTTREALLTLSPRNEDQSWSTVSRWTYTWIGSSPVGVEDERTVPLRYELSQNYPNPFNPTTQINFSVLNKSNVTLKVFNILGQEVKTLVNEVKAPGIYNVNFDASDLTTGMYVYQLQAGSFVSSKKMMLIK